MELVMGSGVKLLTLPREILCFSFFCSRKHKITPFPHTEHVSFFQDVFLLRSAPKSKGPGPGPGPMGPMGPMGPIGPMWAHVGPCGPMGPMGPMWGHVGPCSPYGPMGPMWAPGIKLLSPCPQVHILKRFTSNPLKKPKVLITRC